MIGWYHWHNRHEFEQAPGDGEGQRCLACCSPWDHKESDTIEQLNNNIIFDTGQHTCKYMGKKVIIIQTLGPSVPLSLRGKFNSIWNLILSFMSRRVLVTYLFISPSNMNSFFSKGRLTKNQAKDLNSISEMAPESALKNFPQAALVLSLVLGREMWASKYIQSPSLQPAGLRRIQQIYLASLSFTVITLCSYGLLVLRPWLVCQDLWKDRLAELLFW